MVPAAYNEVLGAALALSPNLRAMLAEHLLQSLDAEPQAEVDALWVEEAEQRVQAVEQGIVAVIPGEQVLGELRSRHRR
ncbi:MAG: addiction module protein [Leptolyngbyaceae cyanobacterium bins.302]|nr:addiction module protein [Leptolyngbyaceae cyanobacterium bins.302]